MFKVIVWILEWYSTYSFIILIAFILLSYKYVRKLEEQKYYRESLWLKRGLYIILAVNIVLYLLPRILFNMFL